MSSDSQVPGTGRGDFPVKGYDSAVVSTVGLVGVRGWVNRFFPKSDILCKRDRGSI